MRIILLSVGFILLTATSHAKASEKQDKNFSIQDSNKSVKYWVI